MVARELKVTREEHSIQIPEKEANTATATTTSQATETAAMTTSASSGSETHQNEINNMSATDE
jgi:hypothetical protein